MDLNLNLIKLKILDQNTKKNIIKKKNGIILNEKKKFFFSKQIFLSKFILLVLPFIQIFLIYFVLHN